MTYVFKGRLCGYLCSDCHEPLSRVKVRLYRSTRADVTAHAVADANETFAMLTDEQVAAKSKSLLIEVETDEQGRFTAELGDKQGYKGEPFEIDFVCGTVPHRKPLPKPRKPLQCAITTIQPRWKTTDGGFLGGWEYCVPYRIWCLIRGLFGAWTICGHLVTCKDKAPIGGATVSAFDRDWLQDDAIGSAVTDASGHFRIDYVTSDFTTTIFSPAINVELTSGPDVYFKAELGGITLIDEPPSTGRTPGRENVGPCFCVELCTDKVQPPDVEKTPHWQSVWDFPIHPAAPSLLSSFSVEGYAGGPANSYAFSGGVPMRGNCPLHNIATGNALKYRFLVGEWTWPNPPGPDDPGSIPSVAPAGLAPVVQIYQTLVGYVFYVNAFSLSDSAPVFIDSSDLFTDASGAGWVRLDGKNVTVDMRDGTNSTVSVTQTNFLRTSDLMTINSVSITAVHPARLPGGLPKADAGRALTTAEREPIRRYQLQFEVRDVVTNAVVATDSLSSIVLDNSPVAVALDLEELRTNVCNPIAAGAVHILYTIDHPHLRSFGVSISNNSGLTHPPPAMPTGNFVPPPPAANFLFRGGAGGAHQAGNNGGFAVNVSGDPPCAYRVSLAWQTRIYNDPGHATEILYCK